jgi:SAM-dependent methyltransferase
VHGTGPGGDLIATVESLLLERYIAAPGAALRNEDRRKAAEVAALVGRIRRIFPVRRRLTMVDLACGQGYAGIAAAHLLGPGVELVGIERAEERVERCRAIAADLGLDSASFQTGEIETAPLPARPDLVIALHACGGATDQAIARTAALQPRFVLVVPCCHPRRLPPPLAGFPSKGVLRRRWDVLMTDARRSLELEAAGFLVTVAELVAPTVSPDNLLFEGRHIGPSNRSRKAREALQQLDLVQAGGFEPPFAGPKPAVLPLDDA